MASKKKKKTARGQQKPSSRGGSRAKRCSGARGQSPRSEQAKRTRGRPCTTADGTLSAAQRRRLPPAAFALPASRQYPLGRPVDSWAGDPDLARVAKGRAKTERAAGRLTAAEYSAVVRAANAVMKACRVQKKRNPAPSYEALHGGDAGAHENTYIFVPDPRGELVMLGELRSLIYRTVKGGELADYEHKFGSPRPTLAVTTTDAGLVIAGGDYKVNERGIVG